MHRFANKVALVTGGASGIGAAVARRLGAEGAKVALVDINIKSLAKQADLLASEGVIVSTHALDLTEVHKFNDLLDEIVSEHGQLDVLFNNAGILVGENMGEISEESYEALQAIHLKSPIFMTQAAIPHLKKTRGCIVNTCSATGTTHFALLVTVYGTLKAALERFSKMTAADGVKNTGIRCNAIAPAVVNTGMTDMIYFEENAVMKSQHQSVKNIGPIGDGIIKVEDVAATVAFLASHEARNITGQTITIDGGRGVYPDEAFMNRVQKPAWMD